MYAVVSIPGSGNFAWHGPATRADCQNWISQQWDSCLGDRASLQPARVISNRAAGSMRWVDGSRVIPAPQEPS